MKKFFFLEKNRKFNAILELVKELESKLSWVPNCEKGMDKIVEFFKITSFAQDEFLILYKDKEYKKLSIKIKNFEKKVFLRNLEEFFKKAGRDKYGWNRTEIGEEPCILNVFIQPMGHFDEMLSTRKVLDHLSRRINPKGEVDYILKEEEKGKVNETELVEQSFVEPFMKKNYQFLQEILKRYSKNR